MDAAVSATRSGVTPALGTSDTANELDDRRQYLLRELGVRVVAGALHEHESSIEAFRNPFRLTCRVLEVGVTGTHHHERGRSDIVDACFGRIV
jgi:hypothetical protein